MSQMKFLTPGSKTWERVWNIIGARNGGDRDCYDEQTGETWQYMCTLKRDDDTVQHQFRHRARTGDKRYDTVEEGLTDQILYDFQ